MKTGRPVLVMQLPERLNLTEARGFLPEVMAVLRNDRPLIVFDFSEVQQIDSAGVEMLLKCLERVMSLDGDLKLAALTPQASVILELTRVDRLFEDPIVDRAQQAAATHGKSLLRDRVSIQRHKISLAKIPGRAERLIGARRRRCRKPRDLPIDKKR